MRSSPLTSSPPLRRLISADRPPPLKSCLAPTDWDDDLEALPSDEQFVRKKVHFPEDKDLVKIKEIPARPPRLAEVGVFKIARPGDDSKKMCIMYSTSGSSTNVRFLRELPDDRIRPRFETRCPWGSVQRSYRLAAAYARVPGSPRYGPAPDGSQHAPSRDEPATSSDGSLPEPASDGSHASAFDMSSLTRALPDTHDTFDMSSLLHALPDPDGSSDASSPAPVPKSLDARIARRPPKVRSVREVQTHVQVGPFSATCFYYLCELMLVLLVVSPSLVPALLAVLALLFLHGACT
ncbi:hypothetical protein N7475_009163 [Penicillium sp. IBT 31633x]|nr:hypothetical protein N7475_009163 [Penicillium sp. IBT 31633x]